ncbi:MAG: RNA polymerase sigma factor [Planctomycetota bacterium]|nr:RNA polymerase sigma factor [Planctomycetota bacterium]
MPASPNDEGSAQHAFLKQQWELHRRWVAAVLLAHKPRYADLDDLLQDVALAVVRHGGSLREAAAFRPWLRTVAVNIARLAARSGRLRQHQSVDAAGEGIASDHGASAPDAGSSAALREGRRLMELAGQLPDGYREPLLLKAVQNLSYREIGHIMELPETTIETRIARARRMLRELAGRELAGRERAGHEAERATIPREPRTHSRSVESDE